MADGVFNISKGAAAEQARDDATKFGILLLRVVQSDALLRDHATVAAILVAANTECNFTNYARKTALTATLTVDQALDRVDLDLANQQWALAGGATNNTVLKIVVFYENAAADATRVPVSFHDANATTDGSNLDLTITNFLRAA